VTSLAGLDADATAALVAGLGHAPYRARQLYDWVFRHGATSYDEMTNLPKELRERLAAEAPVRATRIETRHDSADGTAKLLVKLPDGQSVECVLIPDGDRATACISTQVGCGVGCVFCASGADGVVRNLDAAEIVEQVLWLREIAGGRLTNIVVMGMGEPLHNVAALVAALRLIQHPKALDMGARSITVSTSGPTRGFGEFLEAGLRVKLAISLHAASDGLRKRLVPRGGSGTVADLQGMARRWFEATGRDVTFEYVLIDGINDTDGDARALAGLCGPHRNVNLIPMNPVPFAPQLKTPPPARCERFAAILEGRGVVVHLRRQRGDDVAAACGQLRLSRADPDPSADNSR
jgi:23S rRNA (adenine2503-C2)-methyltransferase